MTQAIDTFGAARAPRPGAWRRELVATLALAWPLILTNLAQTALGATDVLMLSWLSPEALAAGALGANLFYVCFIGGVGLLSGVSAMIAAERGRRRHAVREVRRTARAGLWSAVALALPLWIVLWNTREVLLLLGQDPDLAREAGHYMRAMMWGLLPILLYASLRSTVAALERPILALIVGIGAVALNALLNWALIFGNFGAPALGLVGAGIASALTSTAMCLAIGALAMADRRVRRYRLFGRFWRSDWPRFVQLWRLGLPIAAIILFEVTIFSAALLLMGLISQEALAAHTIAIQIASLSFMVPLGIGMAATVRVGLGYGADDREAVARAGWIAFGLGTGFMAAMALVMVAIPEVLVGLFLDLADPAIAPVVSLAVTYLLLAALFQVVDGAQAVGAGMLRGLQDTRVPMLLAGLGYWVIGLPLAAILAFPLGLEGVGVWLGLAAGLAIVAALLLHRWLSRERLGLVRARPPTR